MKISTYCAAALALAVPLSAHADVNGLYISLSAGLNHMPTVMEKQAYSGPLSPNPGFEINVGNVPGGPFYNSVGPTHYDPGPVLIGAIGYGINSFRFELEGSVSSNHINHLNNGLDAAGLGTDPLGLNYAGSEKKYSLMANVLYDFNAWSRTAGLPITPYIGAGIGFSLIDWSSAMRFGAGEDFTSAGLGIVQRITNVFNSTDMRLAAQGIVGASYDIPSVPGLALIGEMRAFVIPQGFTQKSVITLNFRSTPTPAFPTLVGRNASSNFDTEFNYRFTIGLRYAFNAPSAPPPPAVSAPAAVPAAAPTRSYLVFFDWDKATLTDRARQIVAEAAQQSTRVATTRIDVNGYTDTSGTPQYNEGLSVRRAQAVAAELVKDGVPQSAIFIKGFGEMRPLVPTGAGVREPQNRRVEIIIK